MTASLGIAAHIAAWILFGFGLLGRLLVGMYLLSAIDRSGRFAPYGIEQAYFQAFILLFAMATLSVVVWNWLNVWVASLMLATVGVLLLRGAIRRYRRFEAAVFDRW